METKAEQLFGPLDRLLVLPERWEDLRSPCECESDLHEIGEGPCLLHSVRISELTTHWDARPPRVTGIVTLPGDRFRLRIAAFGDCKEWSKDIRKNSRNLYLRGKLKRFRGEWSFSAAERVAPEWIGHLRPVYAAGDVPGTGHRYRGEEVRAWVLAELNKSLDDLRLHLEKKFQARIDRLLASVGYEHSLRQLILSAHLPEDEEEGHQAHEVLDRLAALYARRLAEQHREVLAGIPGARLKVASYLEELKASLPFALTRDQAAALDEIIADLESGRRMRRVLMGDVGTGKTAVYALAAAAVVKGGGRVAVMAPNRALAGELSRTLASWWPDLPVKQIEGKAKKADLSDDPVLLIGTTALLHRNTGRMNLVVVDEQQKFSKSQREKLLSLETHLLECTATCIPRTTALIAHGGLDVSILRECPVEKRIHTKIWDILERPALLHALKDTIAQGGKILVIYPMKEKGGGGQRIGVVQDAQGALANWESVFPGRVRLITGGMDPEALESALTAMANDEADILLSTTVAEVGLNIPGLKRVMVVNPERLGLSTLHQIRGRVARTGGEGYCDLYLPKAVDEAVIDRLRILEQTTDGFDVSLRDLEQRGTGDLGAGGKQSGDWNGLLPGRKLRLQFLETALP